MDIPQLLEKGKHEYLSGKLEDAIHTLNRVIKVESTNVEANRNLLDIHLKLANNDTENSSVHFRLAMVSLRRLIEKDPLDFSLHEKLIELSLNLNILDELISEYRKKLDKEKDPHLRSVYEKCILKITNFILLRFDTFTGKRVNYYIPSKFQKVIFDFILLPLSVFTTASALFLREKIFVLPGIFLFFIYCVYKIIIFIINYKIQKSTGKF